MPNLIALWTVTLLTRLESDDWGDTTDGTQYEQEDHGYAEHYENIKGMTQNIIIKVQTLKNKDTRKSRTNRNASRKESLERAKMNIRRNDGQVSRPWKVNLS